MNIFFPNFELPLFTNILILLITSRFIGEIFERFKQPAMIGEIIAGVVLGPSLLGIIHETEDIKVISELGIFLLVVMAGLEINLDDILKSLKGKNIVVSMLAFLIPILFGFGVGYVFRQGLTTSLFMGLCIAVTALPVSIRILMDIGEINSKIGQKIISVAIFDDILALSILGVLLNLKNKDLTMDLVGASLIWSFSKLIVFICALYFGFKFIKKITHDSNHRNNIKNKVLFLKGKESLFAVFFIFILSFASLTEMLGFHFIIGAFFASMLISEPVMGRKNIKIIEKTISGISMSLLAPIFFARIGLEFDLFEIKQFWLLTAVILVSYLSKILGGYLGGRFIGMDKSSSITMGIGLNARGIMEIVVASAAHKAGLINTEIFSILVIMGTVTTATTPLLLKKSFSIINLKNRLS
jgi:Kef-type K+ transport system membrane component KefB